MKETSSNVISQLQQKAEYFMFSSVLLCLMLRELPPGSLQKFIHAFKGEEIWM
jgi:hypothetical protein